MNLKEHLYNLLERYDGDTDMAADVVSDILNDVIKKYEEDHKNDAKEKDAQALADHIGNFIKMYYPKLDLEPFDGMELINLLDFSQNIIDKDVDLAKIFSKPEKPEDKKLDLSEMIAKLGW